jgi:hypothetical protein
MNDTSFKKPNLPSLENDSQPLILPRSGWQDRRAFVKALMKTKRALELAEISALIE